MRKKKNQKTYGVRRGQRLSWGSRRGSGKREEYLKKKKKTPRSRPQRGRGGEVMSRGRAARWKNQPWGDKGGDQETFFGRKEEKIDRSEVSTSQKGVHLRRKKRNGGGIKKKTACVHPERGVLKKEKKGVLLKEAVHYLDQGGCTLGVPADLRKGGEQIPPTKEGGPRPTLSASKKKRESPRAKKKKHAGGRDPREKSTKETGGGISHAHVRKVRLWIRQGGQAPVAEKREPGLSAWKKKRFE